MDNDTSGKPGNYEDRDEPVSKPPQPTPASEYTRSMELAEELRLSLLKLRAGGNSRKNVRVASSTSGSMPARPQPQAPAASPAQTGEASDVTLVRGAAPMKPPASPSAREHDATIAAAPKLNSSGNATKPDDANPQKREPGPNQT